MAAIWLAKAMLVFARGGVRPVCAQDETLKLSIVMVPEHPALAPVLRENISGFSVDATVRTEDEWQPQRILETARHLDDPTLRLWIDLRRTTEARLLFWQPSAQRFLVRHVALPGGLNAVGRESVGLVVRVALESLIAGATFDLTAKDMERLLDEPMPAPAPTNAVVVTELAPQPVVPATSSWHLDGLYGARALGDTEAAVLHGPGLQVALGRRQGEIQAVGMAQYQFGSSIVDDVSPLTARFRSMSALLGVSWHLASSAKVSLRATQLAGIDVTQVRAASDDPARYEPAASRTVLSPLLRSALELRHFTPILSWGATVFIELDVLGARYRVKELIETRVLLDSWRVRPGLAVFVGWP